MKKDPSESYKHYFAKRVLASWLRRMASESNGYVEWGCMNWNVKQNCEYSGVYIESRLRNDFYQSEHIIDVVVESECGGKFALEVVNKNSVGPEKYYQVSEIESVHLLQVSADWILGQIGMPDDPVFMDYEQAEQHAERSKPKSERKYYTNAWGKKMKKEGSLYYGTKVKLRPGWM